MAGNYPAVNSASQDRGANLKPLLTQFKRNQKERIMVSEHTAWTLSGLITAGLMALVLVIATIWRRFRKE